MRIFLLLFSLTLTAGESDLANVVTAYWDALAGKDNAAALRLVHPDDWNNFLSNQPTPLTDWKIEKLDFASEESARVTVSGKALAVTGKHEMPASIVQLWEIVDSAWRLRMPPSEGFNEALMKSVRGQTQSAPPPKELTVSTKTLRFYAINPSQPALVPIWNGTQGPVEVVRLEFDDSLFRVEDAPENIPPETESRIRLRYVGEDEEKNLKSSATLVLKHGDEIKEFEIPIVYNYFDKVAAWVLEQQRAKSSGKKPE
ncbi:MAG TPA: hypothetical protein VMY18_07835 [Acidobacteriota bacterium]|nr:hypothetical protein [Acidobacteriota bacterium]